MIRRLYVEKREGFRDAAKDLLTQLKMDLGLEGLVDLRILHRYDVEGLTSEVWEQAIETVFSDPPTEKVIEVEQLEMGSQEQQIAVEYLPGQFDQRADSAVQCLKILADCEPFVRCAVVTVLKGTVSRDELGAVKGYLINPVDSREADLSLPKVLELPLKSPENVKVLAGFGLLEYKQLSELHRELGLAMSVEDLTFCQKYFRDTARRDPTLTEIKLLDTYWSDHCRHTTFLTEIDSVNFEEGAFSAEVQSAWERYTQSRATVYGDKLSERPVCLMDIALMGMKSLRKAGKLERLEVSEEINAASIVVPVEFEDGPTEEWLVMFKNETHNHPTEIEPFGGAATCLGGAIRDPLSGRSYVYQAMRVTGSGDPRVALSETLEGKLPQRRISIGAAEGYSSYGNQIGLATGCVREIYHPKFVAKRMEIGAVIAAAPRSQVMRGTPEPGDIIILVGGRTGRDGVGGATGSSKEHTETALENSAEVQKGDAPTERKLQRLFRNETASRLIKRCNDFGAGGVSVAIGELADSLEINLDAVPLKYAGLDGTEIAISESQERMAVVVDPADADAFLKIATDENLEAVIVAQVTDSGYLQMKWRGENIVNIERKFLDTNGVRQKASVYVKEPAERERKSFGEGNSGEAFRLSWKTMLAGLNVCSQRGLIERFDSTIGTGTILHPFGGGERATPPDAMAAVIPAHGRQVKTATLMSFGYDADLADWSPFHGAVFAVVESVAKIVACGGSVSDIYLTFQEYFERLRDDPSRWGKPFAALLGAYLAQEELGIGAIGGKDSMSGSFKDMDVPPTLVSFAVAPVAASAVKSPEFKGCDHRVILYSIPRTEKGLPDFAAMLKDFARITAAMKEGSVLSASAVGEGGLAATLSRMCFGNRIGFVFCRETANDRLFERDHGALVLELGRDVDPDCVPGNLIGRTCRDRVIAVNGEQLDLDELRASWESGLETVFPTQHASVGTLPLTSLFEPHTKRKSKFQLAKPRVTIPVFPGTNCEYDSEAAFLQCGAAVKTLVFRNLNHASIDESIKALAESIDNCQILMLPGGFSAGDEPAGSGKFIASVFRHAQLMDAVHRLIKERDGLILGICNGFQALVKLGLLPWGEITPPSSENPTLTHNLIGRHVSCYSRTKVVSKLSPWLSACPLGAEYFIPISHGEGRFVASESVISQLVQNDQIATQYVDTHGHPTQDIPENPNGSIQGIEGITSPCGRIFGKMGHSERVGKYIGKNIPGDKEQPIFRSGVSYFLDS